LHIKNLVSGVSDSNSTSYTRWQDQVLFALRRYALDDHVLFDTTIEARDLVWLRCDNIVAARGPLCVCSAFFVVQSLTPLRW
jgi:hypothetical protein